MRSFAPRWQRPSIGLAWFAAAGLALGASTIPAATVSGSAKVIDGDTLEVSGKRIRLFGIDAPEASQICERDGQSGLVAKPRPLVCIV